MTTLPSWIAKVDDLLSSPELDPGAADTAHTAATQARAIWPDLTDDQKAAVLDRLRRLGGRVGEEMDRIDAELATAAHRRAGVRGYGQIRSSHRGQRLRRRA